MAVLVQLFKSDHTENPIPVYGLPLSPQLKHRTGGQGPWPLAMSTSRVIAGSRDLQHTGAVGYVCVMRLCGVLVQFLLVRLVCLDGCVLMLSCRTKRSAATAAHSHSITLLGLNRRRAAAVQGPP